MTPDAPSAPSQGAPLARLRRDPLGPAALRSAAVAVILVLAAALVGAAVRILPWVLDPSIRGSTLAPFARSLLAVAVEAAVLTGWPVGWALAAQRLVDRGEARVLASLGESPARTILRLGPQAALLAGVLALSSLALGREAVAPGRVVNELLAEGRASCAPGTTHGVPFVSATWLCSGDGARLVGRAPIGAVVYTAREASVSDDLRRIQLEDARLALPTSEGSVARVRVRVDTLVLRGLPPWARASSLPPALRAIIVACSAVASGAAVVLALMRARRRVGIVGAAVMGAAGPLSALVALRALELRVPEVRPGAWLLLFAFVPLAAMAAVAAASVAVTLLPDRRRADSK